MMQLNEKMENNEDKKPKDAEESGVIRDLSQALNDINNTLNSNPEVSNKGIYTSC